jgi:hypothetical protein
LTGDPARKLKSLTARALTNEVNRAASKSKFLSVFWANKPAPAGHPAGKTGHADTAAQTTLKKPKKHLAPAPPSA